MVYFIWQRRETPSWTTEVTFKRETWRYMLDMLISLLHAYICMHNYTFTTHRPIELLYDKPPYVLACNIVSPYSSKYLICTVFSRLNAEPWMNEFICCIVNLRFKGKIHGSQEKRIITLSLKMTGPNKLLIQTNAGSTMPSLKPLIEKLRFTRVVWLTILETTLQGRLYDGVKWDTCQCSGLPFNSLLA